MSPANRRSIEGARSLSILSSKANSAGLVSLYSMMTVFSRRTDSLEQFADDERPDALGINPSPRTTPTRLQSTPQLSGSVDTLEDTTESVYKSSPLEICPRIHHLDSTGKKMVVSIVKNIVSLSAPTASASSPLATPKKATTPIAPAPTLAEPSIMAAHSKPATEQHALMPAGLPRESFPQASHVEVAIPEPEAAPAHQPVTQKKAPAKFALGGSCSSSEQGMSVEMSKSSLIPPPKKGMFQIGGSSRSASTKSDIQPAKPIISEKMKQLIASTSRNSQLEAESAIDSDTDDDYVDESAIDDDDSSDWEDSAEESGKSSVDDKFFQRVESRANLVSRPSLITLMVAQNERQKNLSNQTSHSASAIERSRAGPRGLKSGASPSDFDDSPVNSKHPSNPKSFVEVPRSGIQPIKTPTANADSRRRHTPHSVANPKQFSVKPCLQNDEYNGASSWDRYFINDAFGGYHSKGW